MLIPAFTNSKMHFFVAVIEKAAVLLKRVIKGGIILSARFNIQREFISQQQAKVALVLIYSSIYI
jgi:hypothetical protein